MTLDEFWVWTTCTLGPSLAATLAMLFGARAVIRRASQEGSGTSAIRVLAALANALFLSLGLGLVFGGMGSSLGGEWASALSLMAGLALGAVVGGGGTFVVLRGSFVAPVAPDPWGDGMLVAVALAWMFGALIAALGAMASLSLGMFSLAAAIAFVRPLALVFVGLHVVVGLIVVLLRHRAVRPRAWVVASVVNGVALLFALLIAVYGPGAYERALSDAADNASAVH